MRFVAFKYDSYYPAGGKQDFEAVFEHLADAVSSPTTGEYMNVFDCQTGEWHEFANKGGKWVAEHP